MVSLTCTKLTLFTIAGVFIQIIGLSLFVLGFFPVKPALSGVSGPESFRSPTDDSVHNESERDLPPDQLRSLYQELSGIPPFHRLIFMVIDGLPAEFVLGKDGKPPQKDLMEAMPYTQSLLSNGMAIGYHAKAASPTVTMPRLKAMVSGAIAGFLDVAFNFNTQALLDDNLLDQFFRIGWKMVMLGDETWLKLFPGLFTRHDGVSSFFVKDTVQVDQNVSRHLPDELSRHDWDLLIMHYLGLDHVGHIGGRNSVLMAPKLKEMDDVIRMIHLSTILNQSNDHERTLLVVVSDHGMTENGNHGGSSYEETDSLALFVGLQNDVSDYVSSTDSVYQVDIAATLGLLFGVPIPKNNVGVVISEIIRSTLSDERQLRALELNSWQLLRLLQAQLPDLPCGHGSINDLPFRTNQCSDSRENMFCCLYMNATFLHNSWISKGKTRANHGEEYSNIVAVYYEFLRSANEWLSRRLTDQPVNQLAFGVAAMVLSSLLLLSLVYVICKEVYGGEKQSLFFIMNTMYTWPLDEAFVAGVVLIHVLSMSSSSFVEEEHYIWHFVNSTLNLLLLRKVVLYLLRVRVGLLSLFKGQNKKIGIQIITVFVLLISGRILRGWHQGGVNWTYLPDVSKWLAQAGNDYIRSLQLISGLLVVTLSFISLYLGSSRSFILVIGLYFIMSGFLIMHHLMKHQHSISGPPTYSSTSLVQIIFAVLGIGTLGIVVTLPWLRPSDKISCILTSGSNEFQTTPILGEFINSSYMIGCTYIFSWCLLQLLLQQPINSMPIFLLLVQMLSFMLYSYYSGPDGKHWAEVAAFYYIGMAGHFALGNSNSLATIDIAGAFIGISNHSTVLSGILMFIITFASPILAILSMVMYIAVKESSYSACLLTVDSGQVLKRMLSFPCLIPLCLNSIFLTANTFMLLLMRNHLFIWSVFSPKYLYACATTVCVYIGVSVVAATVVYTYWVLAFRKRMLGSAVNKKKR